MAVQNSVRLYLNAISYHFESEYDNISLATNTLHGNFDFTSPAGSSATTI